MLAGFPTTTTWEWHNIIKLWHNKVNTVIIKFFSMGLSHEYDQRQFLIIIIFFQMVLFNVMHYDLSLKRGHVCDNVPLQLSSLPWLSSWPLYQWPGPEIWKSWHWQPEDPFSPSPRDGAWPPPTWRHLHPWRLPSHHRMESPLDKQESNANQQLLLISRDQLLLS